MNKLYVGNLPYTMTDNGLSDLFSKFGNITSASIIMDRISNRSKGFGFVEFETAEEANAAMEALNNTEIEGRNIVVSVARPKEDRPARRPFGGSNDRGGSRDSRGGGRDSRGGGNRY